MNNAFVAKGKVFAKDGYQKIMNMVHKDPKELKQVNMIGITFCFLSNTFAPNYIVDSSSPHLLQHTQRTLQDN